MNLDAIEARCAKATPYSPEKWWYGTETEGHPAPTPEMIADGTDSCTWVDKIALGGWYSKFPSQLSPDDAEFLVCARQDIPALCLEIRRLMAQVAAMREKAVYRSVEDVWECIGCTGNMTVEDARAKGNPPFEHDSGCVFGGDK